MTVSGTIDFQELCIQIGTGNKLSEGHFAEYFHLPLVKFLERRTNDWARSQDLAHDTLLIVLVKLRNKGIEDPTRLSAYVYQVARYVHIGWIRKHENHNVELSDPDSVAGRDMDLVAQYAAVEATEALVRSIRRLKMKRDREILFRRYFKDESKEETCEALSLSRPHYDRVLSRAKKRLSVSATAQENAETHIANTQKYYLPNTNMELAPNAQSQNC